MSRRANKPISPEAMSEIFGQDGLRGSARTKVSHGLSKLLPEVVDRMASRKLSRDATW